MIRQLGSLIKKSIDLPKTFLFISNERKARMPSLTREQVNDEKVTNESLRSEVQ